MNKMPDSTIRAELENDRGEMLPAILDQARASLREAKLNIDTLADAIVDSRDFLETLLGLIKLGEDELVGRSIRLAAYHYVEPDSEEIDRKAAEIVVEMDDNKGVQDEDI